MEGILTPSLVDAEVRRVQEQLAEIILSHTPTTALRGFVPRLSEYWWRSLDTMEIPLGIPNATASLRTSDHKQNEGAPSTPGQSAESAVIEALQQDHGKDPHDIFLHLAATNPFSTRDLLLDLSLPVNGSPVRVMYGAGDKFANLWPGEHEGNNAVLALDPELVHDDQRFLRFLLYATDSIITSTYNESPPHSKEILKRILGIERALGLGLRDAFTLLAQAGAPCTVDTGQIPLFVDNTLVSAAITSNLRFGKHFQPYLGFSRNTDLDKIIAALNDWHEDGWRVHSFKVKGRSDNGMDHYTFAVDARTVTYQMYTKFASHLFDRTRLTIEIPVIDDTVRPPHIQGLIHVCSQVKRGIHETNGAVMHEIEARGIARLRRATEWPLLDVVRLTEGTFKALEERLQGTQIRRASKQMWDFLSFSDIREGVGPAEALALIGKAAPTLSASSLREGGRSGYFLIGRVAGDNFEGMGNNRSGLYDFMPLVVKGSTLIPNPDPHCAATSDIFSYLGHSGYRWGNCIDEKHARIFAEVFGGPDSIPDLEAAVGEKLVLTQGGNILGALRTRPRPLTVRNPQSGVSSCHVKLTPTLSIRVTYEQYKEDPNLYLEGRQDITPEQMVALALAIPSLALFGPSSNEWHFTRDPQKLDGILYHQGTLMYQVFFGLGILDGASEANQFLRAVGALQER